MSCSDNKSAQSAEGNAKIVIPSRDARLSRPEISYTLDTAQQVTLPSTTYLSSDKAVRKTPERQASNIPAETPLPDSPAATPAQDSPFALPRNLTPQVPDPSARLHYQAGHGLAEIGFDRDPRSAFDDQHPLRPLPSSSRFFDRESKPVEKPLGTSFAGKQEHCLSRLSTTLSPSDNVPIETMTDALVLAPKAFSGSAVQDAEQNGYGSLLTIVRTKTLQTFRPVICFVLCLRVLLQIGLKRLFLMWTVLPLTTLRRHFYYDIGLLRW